MDKHETNSKNIRIANLKKKARKTVKNNYLFLIITCLFAAVVGNQFTDAILVFHSDLSSILNIFSIPNSIIDGTQQFFATSNGVFASVITTFTSGTIIETSYSAINSIINSELLSVIIVILISLLTAFFIWFFIGNMYTVISRRIFLESRLYNKISPKKFLFPFYIKKWVHISFVMFVKYLYNALWYCLFIVGGIVKHYSYFLVPYILAENPNISAKQAIKLSRNMMNGHKWKCFLLELSYFGWIILRIFTLGLSGLFYSNSYQIAAYTEYYTEIRKIAKANNITDIELLNDNYLYEKADDITISKEYFDIVSILNTSKPETKKLKNKREMVLDFFGITTNRVKNEAQIDIETIKYENASNYINIIEGNQYPMRLFSIPEKIDYSKKEVSNYKIKYTIPTLILMFFTFCFIGWTWEVMLSFIHKGTFINRGTLHGPWLPIYGSGGLLIITVLYKLRKNPVIEFFSAVILCGVIEYFTAYFLEISHNGMKWWDYTGYFINLHGRICAEGLLVFGLGGLAVVYLLAPLLNSYINKINRKLLIIIVSVLVLIFSVDIIFSHYSPNQGEGISSISAQSDKNQIDENHLNYNEQLINVK